MKLKKRQGNFIVSNMTHNLEGGKYLYSTQIYRSHIESSGNFHLWPHHCTQEKYLEWDGTGMEFIDGFFYINHNIVVISDLLECRLTINPLRLVLPGSVLQCESINYLVYSFSTFSCEEITISLQQYMLIHFFNFTLENICKRAT